MVRHLVLHLYQGMRQGMKNAGNERLSEWIATASYADLPYDDRQTPKAPA